MKYRREVDGLRALAVIPVILFHAGLESFNGGFVGVDVFFVISGYLITTIIIRELDAKRFSIVAFYERRARRILPALFAVMFACVPFAWLWLRPSDMEDFSQSLIAVSLFASNILFWSESGYFGAAVELKPLLHTWSLALEEQFYVFFPLFLMVAWRIGRKWLVVLLSAVALVSLTIAHWGALNKPLATFFLLPTRGWELAIGSLIAFYLDRKNRQDARPLSNQLLSASGLALIVYSIVTFDHETPFPSLYALAPTVGTALIILFGWPHTYVGKLLGHRVLVGIGLISYSAYLWHQPLFAFARHRSLLEPEWPVFATLSALTLVLAALSWRFVKRPFRKKGGFSRKSIFSFAAVGSGVAIGIGVAGSATAGFKNQRTTVAQRKTLTTLLPSPKREQCHTRGIDYKKPNAACTYHKGRTNWAIFGDSHAVELAYGLANKLKKRSVALKHHSFSNCTPAFQTTSTTKGCAAWTRETVDSIIQTADIEYVVVTYRIHAHLNGLHEGKYPKIPDDVNLQDRERRWEAYVSLAKHFARSGKQVILSLQAPEVAVPVEKLILRSPHPTNISGVSMAWWLKRTAYVRGRLEKDLPKEIIVVDPAKLFCDASNCLAVKESAALYFDDNHLSIHGAELVAEEIVRSAYSQR